MIGGAGLILGLIGASNETDESAGTTLLAVSGALLIVSGIALLVAGIINIVGFLQAAKDEEGIKRAVLCTVFSALFTVFIYVLELIYLAKAKKMLAEA